MAGVQIDGVNNKIDFDDDLDTSISANTDDTLVFEAGGTDTMTIINGKVGIGTSPSTNLHIKSTADNSPHLLLENFQNADTDDAAVIELYLNDQTTGGIGDDTDVGVIRFTGDEKDGGTKETYAEIRGVAHDPGQNASNRGHLSFFVQTAGALAETMTIDENRVGIGTVTPVADARLTISSGDNTSNIFLERSVSGQFDVAVVNSGGAFQIKGGSNQTTVADLAEWLKIDGNTGAVTKPLQPAFLSIIDGTQSNIANGNTVAFGTEIYDLGADFASSIFTAPVTGKYQFNFLVSVTQLDYDATYHRVQLVTSNRTFNFDIKSSQNYTADPNYATFGGSMCVDMDTSDTAKLVWSQAAGNSTSDVFDSTYFSGNLVC